MENFDKKIITLLGNKNIFRNVDFLIITNIWIIYDEFNNSFWKENNNYIGFWKSAVLNIDNKKVIISKIPPWNNILDYLKLAAQFKKKIYLCWFCWAINEKLEIWDFLDNVFIDKNFNVLFLKEVNWLIQEIDFYNDLKKKWIDIVDMETETLYNFWKENNIITQSLLVVSDHVFLEPFYKVKYGDERIIQWIKRMINYFIK